MPTFREYYTSDYGTVASTQYNPEQLYNRVKTSVDKGVLILDPPFRRKKDWSDFQSSVYLETVLTGEVKIHAPIVFSELCATSTKEKPSFLLDGFNRVNALIRFMQNDLTAFGWYYCEFTDKTVGNIPVDFIRLNALRDVVRWYEVQHYKA